MPTENHDADIEVLWDELLTVKSGGGETQEAWYGFKAGTSLADIMCWFDNQHSKGVAWLWNQYKRQCPECGSTLKCVQALGSGESGSGSAERIYSCNHCGSAWVMAGSNYQLERFFIG